MIRSTPTGNQIVQLNSTNSGIIVKGTVATANKPQQGLLFVHFCKAKIIEKKKLFEKSIEKSKSFNMKYCMCDKFVLLVLQPAQTTTIAAASTNTSATTTTATSSAASTVTVNQSPAVAPAPGSIEASLLAGQPPGTVIKCVTAQVIQTTEGPRIVLQGLQGADFTAQQLSMVQAQVKQQLLKGEQSKNLQICDLSDKCLRDY